MLILTRRQGETIVIDHETRVTVRAIEGGRVVIGVEAPRGVKVRREKTAPQRFQAWGVRRRQ